MNDIFIAILFIFVVAALVLGYRQSKEIEALQAFVKFHLGTYDDKITNLLTSPRYVDCAKTTFLGHHSTWDKVTVDDVCKFVINHFQLREVSQPSSRRIKSGSSTEN